MLGCRLGPPTWAPKMSPNALKRPKTYQNIPKCLKIPPAYVLQDYRGVGELAILLPKPESLTNIGLRDHDLQAEEAKSEGHRHSRELFQNRVLIA